jgi:hypothetical protein
LQQAIEERAVALQELTQIFSRDIPLIPLAFLWLAVVGKHLGEWSCSFFERLRPEKR